MDTTLSFSSEARRRATADPLDSPSARAPRGEAAPNPLDALAFRFADIDLTPRQLGALGEQYATAWLERRGCTILDRNWRSRYGELDIIAVTPERIVLFVEVKTRRNARYGTPQEAVTAHKRLALRRAGVQWLLCPEHRMAHRGVRFDVIAITAPVGAASPTVNHIREAF